MECWIEEGVKEVVINVVWSANCFLGGSLGWKVRGSLMQDFEKVAYELEPSSTGSPVIGEVKTSEGYHILMVEGRK